jgi:hypothetical protein
VDGVAIQDGLASLLQGALGEGQSISMYEQTGLRDYKEAKDGLASHSSSYVAYLVQNTVSLILCGTF